jgi:hypothetical protein
VRERFHALRTVAKQVRVAAAEVCGEEKAAGLRDVDLSAGFEADA